jgi:hypothetical protein
MTRAQSAPRESGAAFVSTLFAFDRLVHSDWSVAPAKRWSAVAVRSRKGWLVNRLDRTGEPIPFLDDLFDRSRRTLAGFDFPIGLPLLFLDGMGLEFPGLLASPLSERARRFLTPVETLFDVSPAQPFYGRHPKGGRHADLWQRLGGAAFDDLLRECDRKTERRNRAESIFWTVGARQVGKAALAGWQDILMPALARRARLWPFHGPLASLDSNILTIAETYPAEAYHQIGLRRPVGKRSQKGRIIACHGLLEWASTYRISFAPAIKLSMLDGFGAGGEGEDPFDALAGLCGMIEVVDGRRAEAPDVTTLSKSREGWILGQIDLAAK